MSFTGSFEFDGIAALQKWAIYVLIALPKKEIKSPTLIYGGKVGDNNDGCNPVISRLGNHLSENKIHSQLKNKSTDFESIDNFSIRMYYLHLEDYSKENHKDRLNMINESERELIRQLRNKFKDEQYIILNRFTGKSFTNKKKELYKTYLTNEERMNIRKFVESFSNELTEKFNNCTNKNAPQ